MSVRMADLRPYKSLILGRLRGEAADRRIVNQVIGDLKNLLRFEERPELQIVTEGRTRRVEVLHQDSSEPDVVYVKFLHYEERRAPSWYAGAEDLKNVLNHLVVVCQHNRHVAIFLSDSRKRAATTRQIRQGEGQGLGALELIDAGLLNAAFVKGPTRTVWLSGIHARVPVKADNKILSGIDLRDALDPLGDQTYYFTAARSFVRHLQLPIGVSPRGSRVWAGATKDWRSFIETVARLLGYLEATTEPVLDPLPVVAIPSTKVPDLHEAFEVHFLPPEWLAEDPTIDPEIGEVMERWAYRASFEIEEISDNCLQIAVELDHKPVGTLELVFDASDPEHIKITPSKVERAPGCSEEDFEELKTVCRKSSWMKVWFESGHTIAHGTIFEVRHRDVAFDGFRWADFRGYNLDWEKFWEGKPIARIYGTGFSESAHEALGSLLQVKRVRLHNDHLHVELDEEEFGPDADIAPLVSVLEEAGAEVEVVHRRQRGLEKKQIGKQGSLFCWVKNQWKNPDDASSTAGGWLACDDGAMEIADFIHLDDKSDVPVLSLIHVKGARSDKVTRGISVSSYEVVTGQAVKNVRFLDRLHLDVGLREGLAKKIGKLVWYDRQLRTRDQMLDAIDRIGTSYRRMVVVLQPHIMRSKLEEVRGDATHKERGRLRQLDTLLLSAQASCHDLGAEFIVLADEG